MSRAQSLEMIGSHLMDMSHLLAALVAEDERMEEAPLEQTRSREYKMVEILEVTNKKQRKHRPGLKDKSNLTSIKEEK